MNRAPRTHPFVLYALQTTFYKLPHLVPKLTNEQLRALRHTEETITDVPRRPVAAILEDIRSLYNVGSCFRTADAMLLDRLVLTGYTPAPPRKEIAKTALGAERSVPWVHEEDRLKGLDDLLQEGFEIWGIEITDDATSLPRIGPDEIPERLALPFGNELVGVSAESLERCTRIISIPMAGVKGSLNIAVAFGITTYALTTLAAEETK